MFITSILFRNRKRTPLTVWVEPWAEEFKLDSSESIELESSAGSNGIVQIELADSEGVDIVSVFGFPGSRMRAIRDGRIIWECHQAHPPLP